MIKKLLNSIKAGGLSGLGGILWRIGGKIGYSKAFRRVGVSLILTIQALLLTKNLWSFVILPLGYILIGKGYGLPWRQDAGSSYARFWCWILRLPKYDSGNYDIYSGNQTDKVRFLTRMLVALGYGLLYIPVGIILGKLAGTIVAVTMITLIIPIICHLKLTDLQEEGLIGTCVVLFMFLVNIG